jgi:hypothetical protein
MINTDIEQLYRASKSAVGDYRIPSLRVRGSIEDNELLDWINSAERLSELDLHSHEFRQVMVDFMVHQSNPQVYDLLALVMLYLLDEVTPDGDNGRHTEMLCYCVKFLEPPAIFRDSVYGRHAANILHYQWLRLGAIVHPMSANCLQIQDEISLILCWFVPPED